MDFDQLVITITTNPDPQAVNSALTDLSIGVLGRAVDVATPQYLAAVTQHLGAPEGEVAWRGVLQQSVLLSGKLPRPWPEDVVEKLRAIAATPTVAGLNALGALVADPSDNAFVAARIAEHLDVLDIESESGFSDTSSDWTLCGLLGHLRRTGSSGAPMVGRVSAYLDSPRVRREQLQHVVIAVLETFVKLEVAPAGWESKLEAIGTDRKLSDNIRGTAWHARMLLPDPDGTARATMLARLGSAERLEAEHLAPLLARDARDPDVMKGLVAAAGHAGAAPFVIKALVSAGLPFDDAFARVGALAKSKKPAERSAAVNAYAAAGTAGVEWLSAFEKDSSKVVRRDLAWALCRIGRANPEVSAILERLAKDKAADVRAAAS